MFKNAVQRIGPVVELPGILRELKVDVAKVFDGSGIDPGCLTQDTRANFGVLLPLLERAAVLSGCAHIGLLMGLRFELAAHYGPIGLLMQSAPTLKQALMDCAKWQIEYSSGAIVYLDKMGDEYAFGYSSYATCAPGTNVLYDAIIGIAVRMVAELTDGAVQPIEVHVSHRAAGDLSAYKRLLKVPVRFNETRNGIMLDGRAMTLRPRTADPVLREQLLAGLVATIGQAPPRTVERVEHLLRHAMHYGKPALTEISNIMGLHPRTLRRRLAAEGHTFEETRDRVRFSVAREMLEFTDIPVGEIGAMISFASPGVFSEAFARWSSMSPSAWRKQYRERCEAQRSLQESFG